MTKRITGTSGTFMVELVEQLTVDNLFVLMDEIKAANIPPGAEITGWILDNWTRGKSRVSISWEKRAE